MAVVFDQAAISRVQQASDIVEIVSEHVTLARKGKEMVGLCPFHDDHRPSLNVNPTKQIFKCFACGAGGDVFKFIQMRENLTFPQAVERLAQRAHIELKPRTVTRTTDKPDIDPNRLAKLNAWALGHFQKNLNDREKGQFVNDYLRNRQITAESIKKWQIGLAIDTGNDLVLAARAAKIPEQLLSASGLAVVRNGQLSDRFINRLIFTITDVTGRVIGFGGRTLDETGAKYLNSPATPLFDKSNCLYGLQHARDRIAATGTAVVVEGYTDCIMAHQFGIENVVATLGTSFTSGHARILRRYAKKAVLIFDSDAAGLEAANRALEVCLAQRIDISIATLPQSKDPCDFLLTEGAERFQATIDRAVDVFEFKWNRLINSFNADQTIAGRKTAIDEFLQTIATAMAAGRLPAIEKGLIIGRISKIIGLNRAQINSELARRLKRARTTDIVKPGALDFGQGLFAAAQREIIEVLLNEPALFANVKDELEPAQFDVPLLGQAAQAVFSVLESKADASLTDVLGTVESVHVSSTLVQLEETGREKGNFERRLADALDAFRKCRSQKQQGPVQNRDDKEFLRDLSAKAQKRNPHSLGAV